MCIKDANLLSYTNGNCVLTFNIERGDRDYIRIVSCSNCGRIAVRSLFSDDFGFKEWQIPSSGDKKRQILCKGCNNDF